MGTDRMAASEPPAVSITMLKLALLGIFLPLVCITVVNYSICDCLRNEVAEKCKNTSWSYFCVVLNKSAKPPRVLFKKTRLINVLNKTLQNHSISPFFFFSCSFFWRGNNSKPRLGIFGSTVFQLRGRCNGRSR